MVRWIRHFAEGSAAERDLLGGKGANLCEMTRIGLPVPPGFVVTTDACRAWMADPSGPPEGLHDELAEAVAVVEAELGRRYGDPADPLLLSVRSGARVSMPGMMDTVLDLGLNEDTAKGLAALTGDERFAADSWRRFTEMFASVVLGVPDEVLAGVRSAHPAMAGLADPAELDADGARGLVRALRRAVEDHLGTPFPDDPWTQLQLAVVAVFASWSGRRAVDYRRLEGIPDDLGTAVNVQAMVFGNLGTSSGSGVVFTRDPASGAPEPYGDFLLGAQGEDVVAGVRRTAAFAELADVLPDVHAELLDVLRVLEGHWRDLCDVEFTIEQGRLWILQTRIGKRTATAAVRIAVDLVDEGVVDRDEALRRVTPAQLEQLLHPGFDPSVPREVVATGLPASPGAAAGHVRLTADAAEAAAAAGEDVLLVRTETAAADLHGIVAARGVLTSRGGVVSHAAVVARGIGRPAVCGAADVVVDEDAGVVRIGDVEVAEGDLLSIDGSTGEVVLGRVPLAVPELPDQLDRLLAWADEVGGLTVLANADTVDDVELALRHGARGVGLCRTEHQFLGDRAVLVRDVLLGAEDAAAATRAIAALREVQQGDVEALLRAVDGRPLTIRLLDAPAHEFLPEVDADGAAAQSAGWAGWKEACPMLGVRAIRLGLLLPELYEAQVDAITRAMATVRDEGVAVRVGIMLPLVATVAEVVAGRRLVERVADDVLGPERTGVELTFGAMLETPRACLVADEIASHVDFLSFGTNDLTQLTWGFSRDDVTTRLLPSYLGQGLIEANPFDRLDVDGVGRMVRLAVEGARATGPAVHLAACGEHAGTESGIRFLHEAGLDAVSCSPWRVPGARLGAARATLDANAAS